MQKLLKAMRWCTIGFATAASLALASFLLCCQYLPSGQFWLAGWILCLIFLIGGITIICVFALLFNHHREKQAMQGMESISGELSEAQAFGRIGMIAVDDDGKIIWINDYLKENGIDEVGDSIYDLSPKLKEQFESNLTEPIEVEAAHRNYRVTCAKDKNLFIFRDCTTTSCLKVVTEEKSTVLGLIQMDNYSELSKGNEVEVTKIVGELRNILTDFANRYRFWIGQIKEDNFIFLGPKENYEDFVAQGLRLNKEVRDRLVVKMPGTPKAEKKKKGAEEDLYIKVTISIGISYGSENFSKLTDNASQALELAVARGGDQLVVYPVGGIMSLSADDNGAEKNFSSRNQIPGQAQALLTSIRSASNVYIIPKKGASFDDLGACLGLWGISNSVGNNTMILCTMENMDSDCSGYFSDISKRGGAMFQNTDSSQYSIPDDPRNLYILVNCYSPADIAVDSLFTNDKAYNLALISANPTDAEKFKGMRILFASTSKGNSFSSACEILGLYSEHISNLEDFNKNHSDFYGFMYAGLLSKTARLSSKNTTALSYKAAANLRERAGISANDALEYLKQSPSKFASQAETIAGGNIYYKEFFVAAADNTQIFPDSLDEINEIAKIIQGLRGSFIVGRIQEGKVGISAWSDGKINLDSLFADFSKIYGGEYSKKDDIFITTGLDANIIKLELLDCMRIALHTEECEEVSVWKKQKEQEALTSAEEAASQETEKADSEIAAVENGGDEK